MNFYEFASNSPYLTFFLAWLLIQGTINIANIIFNRPKSKKPMIAKDEPK